MGGVAGGMSHDAHIIVWQQRELRRSLIRQLLRWHRERGAEWLRGYVERWPAWAGLRVDFWAQQRLGNGGEAGQWMS